MSQKRYITPMNPTGYWTFDYPIETILINNYTTRACYLNIGNNTIPTYNNNMFTVPAGASAQYICDNVVAFGAALDTTVPDSSPISRGINEQVEFIFAEHGETVPQTASVMSSKTPITPIDVSVTTTIAAGDAGQNHTMYTVPLGVTALINHAELSIDGTTMPRMCFASLFSSANSSINTPNTGILDLNSKINGRVNLINNITTPSQITLRANDQIVLFAANFDSIARKVYVTANVTLSPAP